MKGFLVAICILCCYSARLATGLQVTLAGLPANGYVMNPEGGNPQPLNLLCSYTVDPGETATYVTFFKDGTDLPNQIVVIQVSDGTPRKFNSYTTRADVTASGSAPSFTLTIGGVTMADEGSYRCRVNTEFNVATVTTDEQILSLLYRPNPPQITRGPEVATDTYRVSCSSDGGRPAPEIKWFKISSDQMEVAVNATSNTVTPQGDTFLVESEVEVMATQGDPIEVICQLLHDSLTSQTKTKIIVPESAAPSTTPKTAKPTNSTGNKQEPGASTSGLDGGAVAGIVIAVLIIVAIIVGVVVFLVRKRSAEPKQPKEEQTGAENPAASQTDQRDEKPPIEEYKPEPTTV